MKNQNAYKYKLIFAVSTITFIVLLYTLCKSNISPNKQTIGIKEIFHEGASSLHGIPKNKILTVVSTGDVSLANEINIVSIQKNNFSWPFEHVQAIFKQSDISIINLESPLFPDCILPDLRYYVLCGNSKFIDGLRYVGINVVNIANNHIVDYGVKNAVEEIRQLKKEGIMVSGVDVNSIMSVKNVKVGFLGFNDIRYNDIESAKEVGSKTVIYQADDIDSVAPRIKKMRQKSDVVIVSFHWGKEYTDTVTERQKQLAHTAVDSGADLILGNHPHWIQPIEIYKDRLIVYSQGSLVFNQNNFRIINKLSTQTTTGIIGKYSFFNKKLVNVEFIPIQLNINNQPSIISNKEKNEVLKMLEEKSYNLIK